jgi:hypothetical protein
MKNNKYVKIADGWIRKTKAGDDMVSASTQGNYVKTKLFVELEDGTTVPVKSFAMFYNMNKKKDTHPDVEFTISLEE